MESDFPRLWGKAVPSLLSKASTADDLETNIYQYLCTVIAIALVRPVEEKRDGRDVRLSTKRWQHYKCLKLFNLPSCRKPFFFPAKLLIYFQVIFFLVLNVVTLLVSTNIYVISIFFPYYIMVLRYNQPFEKKLRFWKVRNWKRLM